MIIPEGTELGQWEALLKQFKDLSLSTIGPVPEKDEPPPGHTGCRRLGYSAGPLETVSKDAIEAAKKEGLEIIRIPVGHKGTLGTRSYYTRYAVWACLPRNMEKALTQAAGRRAPSTTSLLPGLIKAATDTTSAAREGGSSTGQGPDWKTYALVGGGVIAVGVVLYFVLR